MYEGDEDRERRCIAFLTKLGYKIISPDKQKGLEERRKKFYEDLVPFLDKGYSREMLRAFFNHWAQVNEGGTKMHWENQKTFEIARRLATWKRNNYGKSSSEQRMHTDGTVLHAEQMDYTKGTW